MPDLNEWKYPIPAARVFVFNELGQLLLLKRTNTDYGDGQWCLPGGKVEYLQSPEAAAVHEVREETGLKLTNLEFLFYQDNPPPSPGLMHCINFYFRAKGFGNVNINRESSAFVWLTIEQAIGYEPLFGAEEALRRYLTLQNHNKF